MKSFAELYTALEQTNKTADKVAALVRYFVVAPAADAAWAVYFLIGRKPRQVAPSRKLVEWAAAAGGIAPWLFAECYHAVGDLAETIALVLPPPVQSSERSLQYWVEERLLPLAGVSQAQQQREVLAAWNELDRRQRFVWNKLIIGNWRIGVSQVLVIRALAEFSQRPPAVLSHRLMGDWQPTPKFFDALVGADEADADISQPYPFCLAHPWTGEPSDLGELDQWQCEWKWDGIRSQLVRRAGQTFLWSRGEELVTDRYPEIAAAGQKLPDGTVLDGEILPWRTSVLPFGSLQRRIGRKSLTKKLLAEVPVSLMAYDLIELEGRDLRSLPLVKRRSLLEQLVQATADSRLLLSPIIAADSWSDLEQQRQASRSRNVEGLMLKRKSSQYHAGRRRGDWWKRKVDPHSIDAVLLYAQPGSGKRASLFTDYTFGVWHDGQLVPVAKAYSGLTDDEIRQVDAFVRRNTLEAFGPVRTVQPELVFELGFEAIQRSSRHKSGVALRFPRMLRWRTDKKPADADSLETLLSLLPAQPPANEHYVGDLFTQAGLD